MEWEIDVGVHKSSIPSAPCLPLCHLLGGGLTWKVSVQTPILDPPGRECHLNV
jgi:hypothetical protein